jgi:hypothetical protein
LLLKIPYIFLGAGCIRDGRSVGPFAAAEIKLAAASMSGVTWIDALVRVQPALVRASSPEFFLFVRQGSLEKREE